jgi:hypothetical protein
MAYKILLLWYYILGFFFLILKVEMTKGNTIFQLKCNRLMILTRRMRWAGLVAHSWRKEELFTVLI